MAAARGSGKIGSGVESGIGGDGVQRAELIRKRLKSCLRRGSGTDRSFPHVQSLLCGMADE